MEEKKVSFFSGKVISGILIIAVGVILLLGTLGYDLDINIWDFWPLILVAIGIKIMASHDESNDILWGFFVFAIGILFQLNKLDYIDVGFHDIWPLILIYIGIKIIISSGKHGHHSRNNRNHRYEKDIDVKGDKINISAILGGGEYNYSNKKLKGGKISAIMGGCEVDLRESNFEGKEMIINVFTIMGGIEMRIPQDWDVVFEGTPILGSMSDKTRSLNGSEKRLIITGEAIMGGVEIKN